MVKLLIGAAALCLSACATVPTAGKLDPAQSVFALESAYEAALKAAVTYKHLPLCGSPGATVVCHDKAVVARLVAADRQAYTALQGAEGLARAHGATEQISAAIALATSEIRAFTGAVPAL